MTMAGELCGWDRPIVMHHYDDTFKEFRRYFFKLFGTRQSLEEFYPLFEAESHLLIRRILAAPQDLPIHIRKYVHHGHRRLFVTHNDSQVRWIYHPQGHIWIRCQRQR